MTISSKAIQDFDELNGWITVEKAAEIVGVQPESLSAKIYDLKFKAVRIVSIILCEKESVEKYAREGEQRIQELKAKCVERGNKVATSSEHKELLAAFDKLSPEEKAKLLASLNSH